MKYNFKRKKKQKDDKGHGEEIIIYKLKKEELENYLKNIESREVPRRK